MNLDNARECNESLALAQAMLRSGCDDLSASSGLALDPDYVAHALLDPDLSAEICSAIALACEAIQDPRLLPQAQSAVDSIARAAVCLRQALSRVADMQGQSAKAISAYYDNL